ncbi:MAG: ABC transporter permease subunit [Proteobacteria bacterium]|nr:ABC transporter permease subunit [Pseudomonadota bacterium]
MNTLRQKLAGAALAVPATLWLLIAFAAPMAIVLLLAVQESPDPFAPISLTPSFAQFAAILGDSYYLGTIASTILLGLGVTLAAATLGYPLALWLARLPAQWRPYAFGIVLIPLLTNVVVRSLGIVLLLSPDGLVNGLLSPLGLGRPQGWLFTHFAVGLALTQVFLPFMVLALYDSLVQADKRLDEAAASLGASRIRRFFAVTLPLSLPGLRAGLTIVFLLASTAYVSATILGGKKVWVAGMIVWQEALTNLNAPTAAAMAVIMLVWGIAFAVLAERVARALTPWLQKAGAKPVALELPPELARKLVALGDTAGGIVARVLLGLAIFLLIFPLALVVVQSFNDVPQASVAGFRAFTFKWYAAAFDASTYLRDTQNSLELAAISMLIALSLALPAAFALVRAEFPGKGAVAAFWMLPLALPHVAIAVGMLRLLQWFIAIPPFWGLVMVHVVVILPFCISMLRTSVLQLDRSLEEAASSLGATRGLVFVTTILPNLAPGLTVAGILAFLISFGEVTVTSFLTTARMQTLPVRIYAEASFSLEPTVHAISALTIVGTVALLAIVNRFVKLDRVWAR